MDSMAWYSVVMAVQKHAVYTIHRLAATKILPRTSVGRKRWWECTDRRWVAPLRWWRQFCFRRWLSTSESDVPLLCRCTVVSPDFRHYDPVNEMHVVLRHKTVCWEHSSGCVQYTSFGVFVTHDASYARSSDTCIVPIQCFRSPFVIFCRKAHHCSDSVYT